VSVRRAFEGAEGPEVLRSKIPRTPGAGRARVDLDSLNRHQRRGQEDGRADAARCDGVIVTLTVSGQWVTIRRMRAVSGWVVLAASAAALLAGCGEGGSDGGGDRPGSPEVYARIESLTDCRELQREFDVADENHGIQSDEGDLTMMRISTSYMKAADERMRALGCYD
jgi:hypothetical protein